MSKIDELMSPEARARVSRFARYMNECAQAGSTLGDYSLGEVVNALLEVVASVTAVAGASDFDALGTFAAFLEDARERKALKDAMQSPSRGAA